jgi:vitamin B12 transporter
LYFPESSLLTLKLLTTMSKKLTLLTTSLLTAVTLLAQKDTLHAYALDPVIVTANKTEQKQSSTGKVMTVISHEQIERSVGKDLAQLLNEQTGLLINGANSNTGKDKSIYLRGASANYTVILLDGIPLNDPSGLGGAYDLRLLALSQIERIEILKGSQSTLYGSNAIAGVINIITRKASSHKTEANALLSYGTYNTFKGNVDVSKKGKVLEYDLNYQYISTDGIAEAKDTTGTGNFPKNRSTQQSFMANLGINVTQQLKISPYFRYSEYKGTYSNDAFSGGNNPFNTSLNNTGLIAKYHYSNGSIYANYGYDFTSRNYTFASYTGRFHHAEAFINHSFNKTIQLVGGVNYQSFSLVKPDSVNTLFSTYASVLLSPLKGLHIDLGGRYNHHNKYGNNFTYSFNPSYLIQQTLKVFVNLSSGFRVPSLNEMLAGAYQLGNPNLKPEKSTNTEGGIELWLIKKTLSITGTYFDRKLTDAIVYTTDPVSYKGIYINRDKQHDQGVEAELSYQPVSKISVKVSYTYVYGQSTQKQPSGKDSTFYNLVRRPKNTVNLSAGYQFNKHLFISSSLQTIGQRSDNFYQSIFPYATIPVTLKAYAIWNMYAEYRLLNNKLLFFADVKNLTNNTNYYEAYGYSVQGFTINTGIHFTL